MDRVPTNGDLAGLHAAGVGYIFNHFTSPEGAERRGNVLHAAGCWQVRRMLGARPSDPPTVRKFYSANFDDAQSWLALPRPMVDQ